MIKLHLDFETYSEENLKTAGAYKYAMDPSTEILLAQWAVDDGPVRVHDFTETPAWPQELYDLIMAAIRGEVEVHAFNAAFEYLVLRFVTQIEVPIERFHCTMVHAWSLSFSGGMDKVGEQIGLPQDLQKLATGKRLINRFCKPAPKNHKARRYTSASHPQEWQSFKDYGAQDVVTEREIGKRLEPYPIHPAERELWLFDQRVNMRGVPVDPNLISQAIEAKHIEKARLIDKMKPLTGLANPNSGAQLLEWLEAQGYALPNLQKETVSQAIKDPNAPELVREVLDLKSQASKTSTSKWDAFAKAMGRGNRVRGMFAFGGAQRTQRWAGRIVQLHNLPQGNLEDQTVPAAELLAMMGHTGVAHFNRVMDVLSSTIRCAITAPEGQLLNVADLGSIESRVLGYLSGCKRINDLFAQGKDSYKDFASEYYNVGYEDVTKAQRKFSKPPVLGCGYQLGGPGLVAYAEGMGVELDEDTAKGLVDLWRSLYWEVPEMWYWLVDTCMAVTEGRISDAQGYGVAICSDENFLFIVLPSGRKLAYYQPQVEQRVPPWEKGKENPKTRATLTYMGMDQYSGKWVRLTTHGGKITENIVQAVARDVLGWQMLQLDQSPKLEIVGHVHDECLTLSSSADSVTVLTGMLEVMSIAPPWAPGLLLGADGFTTKRYRKD